MKCILLLLLKYHVCILHSIHFYADVVYSMSMFTCIVPDMYIINLAITDQLLLVSCDKLYYTMYIPVTDGDTAPSSSQASSTTPQGAVKISSPVVGKCILALPQQVFIPRVPYIPFHVLHFTYYHEPGLARWLVVMRWACIVGQSIHKYKLELI